MILLAQVGPAPEDPSPLGQHLSGLSIPRCAGSGACDCQALEKQGFLWLVTTPCCGKRRWGNVFRPLWWHTRGTPWKQSLLWPPPSHQGGTECAKNLWSNPMWGWLPTARLIICSSGVGAHACQLPDNQFSPHRALRSSWGGLCLPPHTRSELTTGQAKCSFLLSLAVLPDYSMTFAMSHFFSHKPRHCAEWAAAHLHQHWEFTAAKQVWPAVAPSQWVTTLVLTGLPSKSISLGMNQQCCWGGERRNAVGLLQCQKENKHQPGTGHAMGLSLSLFLNTGTTCLPVSCWL